MTRIGTRSNPVWWKARMLRGVRPERQSSSILVTQPHKRFMTKHNEFVQPRGFVEDVEIDSMDAFNGVVETNELECKKLVGLANHQHLRRDRRKIVQAELDYLTSLRQFNICGNCKKPIRVKTDAFKSGTDVNKLTPTTVIYADIPSHYRVYQHKQIDNKRIKSYYEKIEKTRIFNQKCGCGIS
jgi:hypothetical protein